MIKYLFIYIYLKSIEILNFLKDSFFLWLILIVDKCLHFLLFMYCNYNEKVIINHDSDDPTKELLMINSQLIYRADNPIYVFF